MEIKRSLDAKVFDIASKRLNHHSSGLVYYLTKQSKWFFTLQTGLPIQVIPVSDVEKTLQYLTIKSADLIVLDKDFCEEPLELICQLQEHSDAPIILIAPKEKKSSRFIKQAFLSGIHDVLFDPVSQTEWQEMAAAFLRIRSIQTS